MGWHTGALAAFDLETTGVDVETDRIVTACVARVDGSGRSAPVVKQWLADPGVDIPKGASDIHGITTAKAQAEGRDAALVIGEVTEMLARALAAGVPVVGFNVSFDLTLLDRECRRYGLPTLGTLRGGVAPVLDGSVLDRHVSPQWRGKRKLTDVCDFYDVSLTDAHDATADAWAAAGVVVRIAQRHQRIAEMSLSELHAAQVGWKRAQDLEFAGWCRRKAHQVRDADDQLSLRERAQRIEDADPAGWPVVPFERQESLA